MIWLTVFHGSEPDFWRTMNPARLGRLYLEYLRTAGAPVRSAAAPAPGGSLSQYLMGGG